MPTISASNLKKLTPNKAMKRNSLPVTFSACAEKPPATVGRLSRR